MVDLSEFISKPDPTLEAMWKHMEDNQSRETRTYIGASIIGHNCSRHIWYAYNGYDGLPIQYKGLAAIEDGHRTEDLMIGRLRAVHGIEIWTQNEEGKQYGFKDGVFAGNVDGIIKGLLQAPKTTHILELKAVNEKKFAKFQKLKRELGEKNTLQAWDGIYWAQAQVYMRKFDLDRHYTVVATPGGRDADSCRTELNIQAADALEEKANRIASFSEPPTKIGDKDCFECKWCKFREICHG